MAFTYYSRLTASCDSGHDCCTPRELSSDFSSPFSTDSTRRARLLIAKRSVAKVDSGAYAKTTVANATTKIRSNRDMLALIDVDL